jgi:cytochrome c553
MRNIMTHHRTIILVLLCAIATLVILGSRSPVTIPASAGAVQSLTKPELRELTPEEKRGKAFYLRGESSTGQELTAMLGEVDVPASTLTCAGCHGARGEGKTEGGVTAGNLTWSHLTKPYGHDHEGTRKHPAFGPSPPGWIRVITS